MAALLIGEGGYTKEGAAALLGSAQQESGFNPQAQNAGHQGLFQWDDARRRAIEQHFGKSLMSMTAQEQTRAAIWEIGSRPDFMPLNSRLHTSHDLAGNNNDVTRVYEAPGNYATEVPNRLSKSQTAFSDILGAAAGDPVALPTGAPGANGKVDMNVRVLGQPAAVTATTSGDIGLKVMNPGLLGQ